MEAFATTDDYIARYGDVADEGVLGECLADASAVIRAELNKAGVDYSTPTDEFADRLMRVCRSMANRIMPSSGSDIPVGATQASTTAGPYSQQFTFSSGYGTPKLLLSELALLGIGGGKGRMLHPCMEGRYGHDYWCERDRT